MNEIAAFQAEKNSEVPTDQVAELTAADIASLQAEMANASPSYSEQAQAKPTQEKPKEVVPLQAIPPPKQKIYNRTDLGNAERLIAQHGENIRYCHIWKKWLIWNGRTWDKDSDGAIQRLARETVRMIYEEASRIHDKDDREKMGKWAASSEYASRLRDMVKLAQDELDMPISHEEIDRDPMLLSVSNGTLDMRERHLRAHRREDFITKMVEVEFDPTAKCPIWDVFLERVIPGAGVRAFLARAVGLSLTGIVDDQCLFFLHGIGNNGKTTFTEALMLLLGQYAQKAPSSMLMRKRSGGIPNDVARLVGARFVVSSELEQGRTMAEALVKDLTGGDTIPARFLHCEWFDFTPTHKLWIYGNHKPEIRGTDDGIWRRIKLIPFTVQIPEPEQDVALPSKLRTELPGILAWAVRGLADYLDNGLGIPNQVKAAGKEYREEMDEIARFLAECCVQTPQARCGVGALYDAYSNWGGTLKKRRFGKEMRNHGFVTERGTRGAWEWKSLGIVT